MCVGSTSAPKALLANTPSRNFKNWIELNWSTNKASKSAPIIDVANVWRITLNGKLGCNNNLKFYFDIRYLWIYI